MQTPLPSGRATSRSRPHTLAFYVKLLMLSNGAVTSPMRTGILTILPRMRSDWRPTLTNRALSRDAS